MSLALLKACYNGNLSLARRCIRRRDNIAQTDEEGWTPLLRASGKGNVAIVKLLLKSGANVAQTNNEGVFPLGYACKEGFLDVARLLLDHRADLAQADKSGRYFALMIASMKNHKIIVRLLLDRGASVAQTDPNKMTALHIACFSGHFDVTRLLLERGANVKQALLCNARGMTPYQIASEQGHDAIVELLREYGATAVREDEPSLAPCEGGSSESGAALEPRFVSRRSLAKRVCANCGVRALLSATKPQKCGGCWGPRYCGKRCQISHWKSGHEVECSVALPVEVSS